jgi:hypothetical protein
MSKVLLVCLSLIIVVSFRSLYADECTKEEILLLIKHGYTKAQIENICGANLNSKIKGKLVHAITGRPISNFTITATTHTDIEEDKKYEYKITETDENGIFLLEGLSPNYNYLITATKSGYISDRFHISPPKENKTKLVEEPISICPLPSQGVSVWENGNWRQLVDNVKFLVYQATIFGRLNMTCKTYLDIFYPTNLGKEIKVSNSVSGIQSKVTEIENAYSFKRPILFAIYGEKPQNYELAGLYYYPKTSIIPTSKNVDDEDALNIIEGYHIGVKEIGAVIKDKSQLVSLTGKKGYYTDIERTLHPIPLSNICNKTIGRAKNFAFGYFDVPGDAYFAIIPKGTLSPISNIHSSETKRAHLQRLINSGLSSIVFTFESDEIKSHTEKRKEKLFTLKRKTRCNNNQSDMRYGIYWAFYKPIIEFDLTNTYSSIQATIAKNVYYDSLLKIGKGLLLAYSVYGSETALEIVGDAFATIGYASDVSDAHNYAPIVMNSIAAAMKTLVAPTPETIASYVVTNTLSIVNNAVASWKIDKKRHKYETLMGLRDVLHEYYYSCYDWDYVEAKFDIVDPFDECNSDRLTCIIVQYLRKMDFGIDIQHIRDMNHSVVTGVDRVYQNLAGSNEKRQRSVSRKYIDSSPESPLETDALDEEQKDSLVEPFLGVWKGYGVQENGKRWTIEITIQPDNYSIEYPSLGCGGKLSLLSTEKNKLAFREKINFGKARCVDNGEVQLVKVAKNRLSYSWYFASGTKGACGELTKFPTKSSPLRPKIKSTGTSKEEQKDINSLLTEVAVFEQQGKYFEALEACKRVLDLSPGHEEAEEAYLRLKFKVLPRGRQE